MGTFAVQCNATPLCVWTLGAEHGDFHPSALERNGLLVLPEDVRVGFVLDGASGDCAYRIHIGDVSLTEIAPTVDDASGVRIGERLFWRDLTYFDSARGETPLLVEERSEATERGKWETILSTTVYVLPSKLGEERYRAMSVDLGRISHGLLIDLYGKSRKTMDVRQAGSSRTHYSAEAELQAIESVLVRIGGVLESIALRPASRIVLRTRAQQYWGTQSLHATAVAALARRGVDLRSSPRPVRVATRMKMESFDIAEHRFVQAFLALLVQRCGYCGRAAAGHARAITSERHLRDVRLGEGPTLYESVDRPRIARLQEAVDTAKRCEALAESLQRLPFLKESAPAFHSVRGGLFQRNEEYLALFLLIRRFLVTYAQWYEGEGYAAVTKLTWRLFEQWTFLRLVDAFRAAGAELREWSDALRQNLRSRFIIDFERGLMFEAALGSNLRMRFRYEPWVLGLSAAEEAGESVFRGQSGKVA